MGRSLSSQIEAAPTNSGSGIYLDKNQKIPAPVLKDFLADAGYRLLDHSMVRVS